MDYLEMTELRHHGILGQKWGIRRYQNEDGTLTAAGKERYAKAVSKLTSKNKTYAGRQEVTYKIRDNLREDFGKEIDSHINNIREKRHKFEEISNKFDPFGYYDSKECEEDSAKAYDATVKWFKDNDPSYLTKIQKQSDDLVNFHDFRKVYEAFESEYWEKGEREYWKKQGIDPNDLDRAHDEYVKACEDAGKALLNEYGNTKISSVTGEYRSANVYKTVNNLLSDAIRSLDIVEENESKR